MNARASGILCHITSLPGPYGIGDLGPQAHDFVNFLKAARQKYWQILPINPTDGINGHSPYSCFSAFAGNPLLISPAVMAEEGFVTAAEIKYKDGAPGTIDYPRVIAFKERLFDAAHSRWHKGAQKEHYQSFVRQHEGWLDDYAMFIVAKALMAGQSWNEWPAPLKARKPQALARFIRDNARAIERAKFIQYLFFRQWEKLKNHAHNNGIAIIGDIPIYVNYDSVEVWRYPGFFKLNSRGELKFVSGCPPDYFSKTGQRWGNPVYDWAKLKQSGYQWWVRRISHNLALFDFLRIDHFRGFISFWQIPAHERLAVFGRWVKAPGENLFKALLKEFKHLPLIAEDLGEITSEVVMAMKRFGFPGMRVLLFAFGGNPKTNPHVPANYASNCVAYTGTHDNNTIRGWFLKEAKPHERSNIQAVLKTRISPRDVHWSMIRSLMGSRADTVIIALQDVLGLGEEARMNTPATKINNWKWRSDAKMLSKTVAFKLASLTRVSKRV